MYATELIAVSPPPYVHAYRTTGWYDHHLQFFQITFLSKLGYWITSHYQLYSTIINFYHLVFPLFYFFLPLNVLVTYHRPVRTHVFCALIVHHNISVSHFWQMVDTKRKPRIPRNCRSIIDNHQYLSLHDIAHLRFCAKSLNLNMNVLEQKLMTAIDDKAIYFNILCYIFVCYMHMYIYARIHNIVLVYNTNLSIGNKEHYIGSSCISLVILTFSSYFINRSISSTSSL